MKNDNRSERERWEKLHLFKKLYVFVLFDQLEVACLRCFSFTLINKFIASIKVAFALSFGSWAFTRRDVETQLRSLNWGERGAKKITERTFLPTLLLSVQLFLARFLNRMDVLVSGSNHHKVSSHSADGDDEFLPISSTLERFCTLSKRKSKHFAGFKHLIWLHDGNDLKWKFTFSSGEREMERRWRAKVEWKIYENWLR